VNLIAPNLNIEKRSIRFELPPLPRLADLQRLDRLRARLSERASGELNAILLGRLETLRQRLRTMPFEEATNVAGRERLLLKLYLLDQGAGYMQPFNERICEDLLGDGSELRKISRLRQAADLFFAHFDHLPGHLALGRLLRNALARPDAESHRLVQAKCWRESRESLFTLDGPQRFVAQVRVGENLSDAAERCGVPQRSRFLDLARQQYLFRRLQELPRGDDDPSLFQEVTAQAPDQLADGELVGVRALQILIRRCVRENADALPPRWGERIADFACDPRLPRRSSEFRIWWQWANEQERAVALSWFTGRDLETFLTVLQSSLDGEGARMFPRRCEFLRKLFRAGKIKEARLVLTRQAFNDVMRALPGLAHGAVARMRSNDGISVICIRCDDFCFVEGTHSFAIQLFKELPIDGFWEKTDLSKDGSRSVRLFDASDFRAGRLEAIHHRDSRWQQWEGKFIDALAQCFHVAWQGWRHW
jgi:hypothetical protein